MKILQVSTSDGGGGAERVARRLHAAYQNRSHQSWLAVGNKGTTDPSVLHIDNGIFRGGATQVCFKVGGWLSAHVRSRRARRAANIISNLGQFARFVGVLRGREDFDFPATHRLLDLPPQHPDIVHCHNLHGGYFDLRALPSLTESGPVLITLHDSWLFSGHCAQSFECDRWKSGCGKCPDLTIYPAIKKDSTAFNWVRKGRIFSESKLYVSTPSQWLMDRVNQSIVKQAAIETRVIPYGIDLGDFRPADRNQARATLGLPLNSKIVLSVGNYLSTNPWKDFQTMRAALEAVSDEVDDLLFIVLGDEAFSGAASKVKMVFVSYKESPEIVARYYQAADIYLHGARVDTFPNSVLEALACGIPVVASAVGGIPEQVRALKNDWPEPTGVPLSSADRSEATGMLVPSLNHQAMAEAVRTLFADKDLRRRLGENAATDARKRFDQERMVDDYLAWYAEILSAGHGSQGP